MKGLRLLNSQYEHDSHWLTHVAYYYLIQSDPDYLAGIILVSS